MNLTYLVGTMIEVARGALTADEIAQTAEFFSFGTNDLTQTALGMSRDNSGTSIPACTEAEIIKKNPFASIDQTGVGQFMKIAVSVVTPARPDAILMAAKLIRAEPKDLEDIAFLIGCHRPDSQRIRQTAAGFERVARERATENLVYLDVLKAMS